MAHRRPPAVVFAVGVSLAVIAPASAQTLANPAASPLPLPPLLSLPLPPDLPPLPLPPDANTPTTMLGHTSWHPAPRFVASSPTPKPVHGAKLYTTNLPARLKQSADAAQSEPPLTGVTTGVLGLAAVKVAAPEEGLAAALLPFGPRVGAAAFRRGSAGYVVFDARRPIDLSSFTTDPVFGAARVLLLPQGTLLRVPLAPTLRLALARQAGGWVVAVTRAPSTAQAIVARVEKGSLVLPLHAAAEVVAVPDPLSGADLLVGTTREPGARVAFPRDMPGFLLLRTWQGVVVAPHTDRLSLDPSAHGFALGAGDANGLPLAPEPRRFAALQSAAALTRRFAFPALSVAALARRLGAERATIIAAAPRARFAPRLAKVRTLIALGMGPEAESLLKFALAENPNHARDPNVRSLGAIAALLADRLDQSAGLTDPKLSGSDEVTLWRATRAALLGEDPAGTAPQFAATAPLILAYPAPLEKFLAPIAAEAMIAGGELDAAENFLAHAPKTPRLDLDRAALLAARGKSADALTAYERLTRSIERPVAAHAASRAVLLQHKLDQIDARMAADALAKQLYAWRGPRYELRLRLKIAELRADSGQWRQALALLRQTATLFPKEAGRVNAAREATFNRLFASGATEHLGRLALVSLIQENADLIPQGAKGERLAEKLADHLVALGLPDQAVPVLTKTMQNAAPGVPQATLGAKLAAVRLAGNDPKGALAALKASRAADLPTSLAERRTLLYARAAAATGHTTQAMQALGPFDDAAALAMRAKLMEKTKHWQRAEAELAELVRRAVPESGALAEKAKGMLVRLASAASQAGDALELLHLRISYGARMGAGPLAATFHLFTDPPVQSLADLPVATRDTAIAERLPEEIKAIGGRTQLLP